MRKKHNGIKRCFEILKKEGVLYSTDPRFETTHVVANSVRTLRKYYGVPIKSEYLTFENSNRSYRAYKLAYEQN